MDEDKGRKIRSVSFFILSGFAHPCKRDDEAATAAELKAPVFIKFSS